MLKRILLITILAFLAGCSNGSAAPVETTLHLGGLGGKPTVINPLITNRTVSTGLLDLIFNKLVRLNKDMLPEPDLAESWDISDDGITYIFHLRKGVRFHDGVEFTADDCKFTYELAANPATGFAWCSYYTIVEEWEVIDKYTFQVILKEPYASFLSMMWVPIVPKHLLEGRDIKTAEFNQHPIGTGPFRFSGFCHSDPAEAGEESLHKTGETLRSAQGDPVGVILEANPDYYEGRPSIDKIIATGYDDPSKYWGAFMRGENDIVFFLSKEDFEIAKRDQVFKTHTATNVLPYGIEYNPEHPFFKDKNIRKALAYAIDTKEIIEKAEKGYATPATGPFLPGYWSCNPEIKPIEYNPQKALALLKEAGWELNKKHVLEKDNKEFRFNLLVNNEMRDVQMIAYLIYQHLFKIGIRMELVPYDTKKSGEEKYRQMVREGGAYLFAFVIITGSGDVVPDYWHSERQPKAGLLWQHLNPEINRLLELGEKTHKIDERQKIYYEVHRLIAEEQPVTFLYFFYNLGAVNARFQNTDGVFTPLMPFWTIKDWRVSKNIR